MHQGVLLPGHPRRLQMHPVLELRHEYAIDSADQHEKVAAEEGHAPVKRLSQNLLDQPIVS
jgi:hypothetical protein